ncbi:MAG: hypothetical protein FWC26_03975 [Fibromonadales bacterium]|nr:hypothetical protein [Fibromonadales bacterium]
MDLIVDCSRKGVRLWAGFELSEPEAKGDELSLLIDRMNIDLEQVKRVLVTLGPGSFTGIRAGIAFCEGLCFSGKRTLHGISTLKALAMSYGGEVILHARANLYYVGTAESESIVKFDSPPQTCENLSIAPFAKLIDSIAPSPVQKANYMINPFALN